MKLLKRFWQPSLVVWVALLVTACGGQVPNTGARTNPQVSPTVVLTMPAAQPTTALSPNALEPTAPLASATALSAPQTSATPASTEAGSVTVAPSPTAAEAASTPTAGTAEAASPAPACTSPAELTPAMTEGPYFKAGAPERTSLLESGMPGTKVMLTGYVLTTGCQPVANARLEFWQADAQGQYDNSGFTLRGHQFTDASGRYQLETVLPGEYPGRTVHIHVKIQAPDGPELTSQLFFPDVASNQSDRIFDEKLVVTQQVTPEGIQAQYNFIVNTQ